MLKFKKTLFCLFLFLNFNFAGSNFVEPVNYKIKFDNDTIRPGEVISLILDLKISEPFYVYSSNPQKSLSPSSIEWQDTSYFDVIGILEEPNPKTKFSKDLDMEIGYHNYNVNFEQKLKVSEKINPGSYELNGTFIYQACDPIKCIPHWDDFNITINVESGQARLNYIKDIPLKFNLDDSMSKSNEISKLDNISSLFEFFLVAFLAGLAALLTPCVFPMIPMTVAFFTGKENSRVNAIKDASIFGLSIIFIYSVRYWCFHYLWSRNC